MRRRRWALVDGPNRLVLSVAEAAEMLGISRTLAYELVARGELPARRFGGRIVVLLRPLERLLDGGHAEEDSGLTANSATGGTEPRPSIRAL
jgi:excisionase family DNA binding protein